MTEASAVLDPAIRDEPDSPRRWDHVAVASILAGAVIRLVWGLAFHPAFEHVFSDSEGYVDRAARLAMGGPFKRYDTFYPPGNHVLLAIPFRIFGTGRAGMWAATVLWTLLSCAIPYLVWRISRRLIGPRAGAFAAGLAALWPLFIAYGGFFMSEIPSIAILLSMILLGLKTAESSGRHRLFLGAMTGLCAGISIVMRPQLGLNVLVVGWLLFWKREQVRALALATAIGLLLPIAGIVSLNWAIADRPVVSENAGVNFFHAHCPVLISWFGRIDREVRYFGAPPTVELDRGRDYYFPDHYPTEQGFLFREALRCVRNDGITHVGIMIRNVAEMGMSTVPWPPSTERGLRRFVRPANVIYSVALPTIIVASVVLVRRKRRRGEPAGEGVLLAHMAPMLPMGAFFVGDPRYRMAYDAFGLALAAVVAMWGVGALRRRWHPPDKMAPGRTHGESG